MAGREKLAGVSAKTFARLDGAGNSRVARQLTRISHPIT